MKLQKVFVCDYCLPVSIRSDVLPCKVIVYGNMSKPVFCPYNGERCNYEFLNYLES